MTIEEIKFSDFVEKYQKTHGRSPATHDDWSYGVSAVLGAIYAEVLKIREDLDKITQNKGS